MQAVILAGGLGTRLSEETNLKPKPMVEIGGKPILWHILNIFSKQGINDFIVCCGYKGYLIKEYFANYVMNQSNMTIDLQNNSVKIFDSKVEPWKITLVDTGEFTMTGGRLKRIKSLLNEDPFIFTYGDGLADINLSKLIAFHNSHNSPATITAVQPAGRYGSLKISNKLVTGFAEKPKGDGAWINGGFFVLEKSVIDYIKGDDISWENEPLKSLVKEEKLMSFQHNGFWHPMDTLNDKRMLEDLWLKRNAPWEKVYKGN